LGSSGKKILILAVTRTVNAVLLDSADAD